MCSFHFEFYSLASFFFLQKAIMIELGYILNIAGVRLVFGVYNFYMHSSESVRAEPAAFVVQRREGE